MQHLFFFGQLIGARVRSESKIGGLGEGFGLLRAHINSKMLQNCNRGRMAAMCLDDACTIQFTGLSSNLHSSCRIRYSFLWHRKRASTKFAFDNGHKSCSQMFLSARNGTQST